MLCVDSSRCDRFPEVTNTLTATVRGMVLAAWYPGCGPWSDVCVYAGRFSVQFRIQHVGRSLPVCRYKAAGVAVFVSWLSASCNSACHFLSVRIGFVC